METLQVKTNTREEMVNITTQVQSIIRDNDWRDGAVMVYCPHTTGGITVNEAADPDVARDITVNLRHMIPRHGDYRHMEGNSDAHMKTSLVGPSQLFIVENGEIQLGTWQGIFFCEYDGPRSRKVWVKWLSAGI